MEAWRYSEEVNRQMKAERAQSQREDKGSGLADQDVDTVHYRFIRRGKTLSNGMNFTVKA